MHAQTTTKARVVDSTLKRKGHKSSDKGQNKVDYSKKGCRKKISGWVFFDQDLVTVFIFIF